MSDGNGNGHGSMKRNLEALTLLGMLILALATFLSQRTLNQIDEKIGETAKKVETIQGDVTRIQGALEAEKLARDGRIEVTRGALDSKIEKGDAALSDRITGHEHRLIAVEKRVQAHDQQIEDTRRKLWERKSP